jgi:excisionase family DNA binding protein
MAETFLLGGMTMADLVSLKEGAEELKISIYTLRSWVYQRRIRFVRLGRRVLIRREDIEDFVKRHLVEAKEN